MSFVQGQTLRKYLYFMGCVRLAWHCGKMYSRYPFSYFGLNRMLSPRVTTSTQKTPRSPNANYHKRLGAQLWTAPPSTEETAALSRLLAVDLKIIKTTASEQ